MGKWGGFLDESGAARLELLPIWGSANMGILGNLHMAKRGTGGNQSSGSF